jgi:hypothetical protein
MSFNSAMTLLRRASLRSAALLVAFLVLFRAYASDGGAGQGETSERTEQLESSKHGRSSTRGDTPARRARHCIPQAHR